MSIAAMPFETYAGLHSVNFSRLKHMADSPAHYHYHLTAPRTDTPRLAFGRMVHTAVLEPDRMPLEYAVWPGGRRFGKEYDAFLDANEGRTIVREDEYLQALSMRDAVLRHPVARWLMRAGKAEQVITWDDADTGLPCRGRVDWLADDCCGGRILVDLKTCSETDARLFGQSAARWGYHAQLAFYRRGLIANGWPDDTPVRLIAVEVDPPHDVAVFDVDEDTLWCGEELVDQLLAQVKDCTDADTWPGRYPREVRLQLPGWAFPEYEERLA